MTDIKDRRLDRIPEFDERSRAHPVTAILPREALKPRSYRWRCMVSLDQGREGACVGFGWSHELAARPVEVLGITNDTAYKVYKLAQTLDPWEGENYSGTSVLAGAKAVQALYPNAIQSYKWAFGIEEVIATLGYHGPVVLGVNWYSDMYEPDEAGFIKLGGSHVGGHCILAVGNNQRAKYVILQNSWGPDWGVNNGQCHITHADLATLLRLGGEACVPVGRKQIVTN